MIMISEKKKKNMLYVISVCVSIFFCVQQKKETHTGLEQLEDE